MGACVGVAVWRELMLTGHGDGQELASLAGFVTGEADIVSRVSALGGAEDQVQAVLPDATLRGQRRAALLPPHVRLRMSAGGPAGHTLHGVHSEGLRHGLAHVVELCESETKRGTMKKGWRNRRNRDHQEPRQSGGGRGGVT